MLFPLGFTTSADKLLAKLASDRAMRFAVEAAVAEALPLTNAVRTYTPQRSLKQADAFPCQVLIH